METADVVLMSDNLRNIPFAIFHQSPRAQGDLAEPNDRNVSNHCAHSLSARFSLPLTLGVVGHEGSTVLVCLNGLRLLAFGARESTDCTKTLGDRIDEAKSVV